MNNNISNQIPKVFNYTMRSSSGDPIRRATEVVFNDGTVIRFTELMSKKEAIKQALYQRSK